MPKRDFNYYLFILFKMALSVAVYIFFLAQEFFEESFFDSKVIVIGPASVRVKVADSIEERAKGLSGTTELGENRGMFFVFDEPEIHGIWMKDMNYSIDIIWLDEYGKVVHIQENVSPKTYPKVFDPPSEILYVLEVNAGFVQRTSLGVGDSIDLY
jgi:uncharacterized membrane protein (UPF0127 family)